MAETASGPRAAQIQAVRKVLIERDLALGIAAEALAAELVDAVHAAGREQGTRPTPHLDRVKAERDELRALADHRAEMLEDLGRDYNKLGQLVHELRQRADQGEARGYQQAVDNLKNDRQRFRDWCFDNHGEPVLLYPTRDQMADYLEAVGPDGTAQLAPDHGTATPEDHALVARATGGRITSREIQPEYDDGPATAAETGQDGAGVGGGSGAP